jgi:hypothetical protein
MFASSPEPPNVMLALLAASALTICAQTGTGPSYSPWRRCATGICALAYFDSGSCKAHAAVSVWSIRLGAWLMAVLVRCPEHHSPETVGWFALENRERGLDRSRRCMVLLSERCLTNGSQRRIPGGPMPPNVPAHQTPRACELQTISLGVLESQ